MSERLTPLPSSPPAAIDRHVPAPPQRWPGQPTPTAPAAPVAPTNSIGALIGRSMAALRRYRWLVLAVIGIGTAVGVAATSFLRPEYETQASIWLSDSQSPLEGQGDNQGPIRANEIFRGPAWVELIRSYRIADSVVARQRLYVTPEDEADSLLFQSFNLGARLVPGLYELETDANRGWVLRDADHGGVFERGRAGDSIGRKLGFRWAPPPQLFTPDHSVTFSVVPPRQASVELRKRLQPFLDPDGAFLQLSLKGRHPQQTASTLNTWMEEFIKVATDFRKAELGQFARDLSAQLDTAAASLRQKELALQGFRAGAITQASENAMTGMGLEIQNPVLSRYTEQKVELETAQRDLAQLQQTIANIRSGATTADALMFNASVANGPQGDQLRQALQLLSERKGALRQQQLQYTDEHPLIIALKRDVATLEREKIPALAASFSAQLGRRVASLGGQVSRSTSEIRAIPARTIEEGRLKRDVAVAENLYTTLKNRYDQAQLAEKSAMPGVRVMDEAVAPVRPTTNTKPQIILGALFGSIVLALAIALLLDRLDRRFRYPQQVSDELGLDILGAVPALKSARARDIGPEEASQMVESFRSIRLALRHTFASSGPVVVAVTSPGIGDGKSFVSSNLAMSFAEAGHRTLLIDGDIRRGEQHATFNVDQQPGLSDYLAGEAGLDEVVVPTEYDRLSLMPRGTRRRRGPELLASADMTGLIDMLRTRYDAILIDSAPLGAGTDAYALGVAGGSVLLVFREGKTDRKMAQAKLGVLDRLPVHMLGAVLNCVPMKGSAYEYYSYLDGYAAEDDEETLGEVQRTRLTSGNGVTR